MYHNSYTEAAILLLLLSTAKLVNYIQNMIDASTANDLDLLPAVHGNFAPHNLPRLPGTLPPQSS